MGTLLGMQQAWCANGVGMGIASHHKFALTVLYGYQAASSGQCCSCRPCIKRSIGSFERVQHNRQAAFHCHAEQLTRPPTAHNQPFTSIHATLHEQCLDKGCPACPVKIKDPDVTSMCQSKLCARMSRNLDGAQQLLGTCRGYGADATSGLVHVPVDASPDHVYTWLEVCPPYDTQIPSNLLWVLQHVCRNGFCHRIADSKAVRMHGSRLSLAVSCWSPGPAYTLCIRLVQARRSKHTLCAVQKHAAAAAAAARQQFAEKSKLDDLTDRTWRRLRMRSLSRHPDLGREQFQAACLRLLAASKDLALVFDGLKIQLGLSNSVSADGDVIEVAWNFEV